MGRREFALVGAARRAARGGEGDAPLTCCVAVAHAGVVHVGADSFLGNESTRELLARPKLFARGDVLVAWAGDVRAAQLLEHAPPWRARRRGETAEGYLVTVVAESARKAHEHASVTGAASKDPSVDFLVAYEGAVWTVQRGYGVLALRHGYGAVGAGEPFALGSLASTEKLPPRQRVELALAAAARHSPFVARPFHHARHG